MENKVNEYIYSSEHVDIICPKCGHNKSYKVFYMNSEFGECVSCGALTYRKVLRPLTEEEKDCFRIKSIPTANSTISSTTVKCPYCHSTNTKKISTLSKAGSVALFGIFSIGKVSKEWHCNNCNSNF